MSFQDDVAVAAQEGTVGVVWLIGDDLKCYYQYGDWAVDPTIPFDSWKNQKPSVDFGGGLKFTVITMSPERLISTNMGGQGHLIVARCPKWAGCVISWCPATVQKDIAYATTARLAAKVA